MQPRSPTTDIAFLSADLEDTGTGGAWCDRALWEGLSPRFGMKLILPYAGNALGWVPNATVRAFLQNIRLLGATRGARVVLVDAVYARETFLAVRFWSYVLRQPVFGLMYHLRHHLTRRPVVRRFERFAEGAFLRGLSRAFVLSHSGRAECMDLGVPAERITTIPVVARSLRPDPGTETRAAVQPGVRPVTFLFVGTVERRKGLDAALRALGRYRGSAEVRFRVVGRPAADPAYAAELNHLAAACSPVLVEWWGTVSDARLAEAYRDADAFLFPSRWEGYGMAIEEAMQAGLPVVCYGAGSVGELVKDGETGWVADADDEDGLAAAVRACVDEPEERVRRGRAAAAAARRRRDRPPIWHPVLDALKELGVA